MNKYSVIVPLCLALFVGCGGCPTPTSVSTKHEEAKQEVKRGIERFMQGNYKGTAFFDTVPEQLEDVMYASAQWRALEEKQVNSNGQTQQITFYGRGYLVRETHNQLSNGREHSVRLDIQEPRLQYQYTLFSDPLIYPPLTAHYQNMREDVCYSVTTQGNPDTHSFPLVKQFRKGKALSDFISSGQQDRIALSTLDKVRGALVDTFPIFYERIKK